MRISKSNRILFFSLLVLAAIATWLLGFHRWDTSLSGGDWEFGVKDTASISRVFLADASGKSVLLERRSGYWTVNGKHIARPDAMTTLLQTIKNVEISYRLPRPAVPVVIKDIAVNKIKVEIYAGSRKIKSYYVGGVNQDETGVNMIMEESNEPYVCSLSHWKGNIRVRFITDEMVWRDRTVFSESPDQIQAVSIDYPLQKSKSFRLDRNGANGWEVKPLYDWTTKADRHVNQEMVESFLTGFKKQIAEGFENDHPQRDSIQKTLPFAIIHLTNTSGTEKTVSLFPLIPVNPDGTIRIDRKGGIYYERFYAQTNEGDFMMVQNLNFEKILWAYLAFFQ